MVIHRFVSSRAVIQAVVGCSRHNIIQIGFNKRDGSLLVSFPYGKHSQGLLSIGTIPAGRATAEVSLVERGKCASHKVKYTHHPDGRAHFSQDGKICTKIARQSVPLNPIEGHVFTVQAAGLHEFRPATRPKDLAEPTDSRVNLPFELGSELPQAIKIVGQLYDATTLETRIVGGVPSIFGPSVPIDAFGQSSAFLVGNPSPALANMILLVTCQIMPPQKPWSGLIFQGGFDPLSQFDDVSYSASFLALSYPIENFDDLEVCLGSVDYEPSQLRVAQIKSCGALRVFSETSVWINTFSGNRLALRNTVESNRVTKAKSQTFAPVGRCIYCNTTAGSLTREHIVPIGLGGGLILPKASCTECSAVTKSFETTCQRKMFVRHRLAQGLVRHQSEIPDEVRNLPNFLIIPFIGGLPGMIAGKNPQIFFRVYGMAAEWAQLSDAAARAVALAQEFNMIAFTRMLAKIAHSFAVSQLTIEGFDAELLELIMGASPHLGPFLIGESTEQVPIPENILHQVGMTFMPWGQRWLVIVRIRLWASHGTPGYNVIAGQLIETPERLTRFDLRPLR